MRLSKHCLNEYLKLPRWESFLRELDLSCNFDTSPILSRLAYECACLALFCAVSLSAQEHIQLCFPDVSIHRGKMALPFQLFVLLK